MAKSKRFLWNSLFIVGAAMVTLGLLWLTDYIHLTQVGEEHPSQGVITTSEVKSEKRPSMKNDDYSVPNSQPRKIEIPSIQVDAYIQRVGVTKSDEMATPNNLFFVGWYVNGAIPGDSGLSIINGHAGGRYADGIFRHLSSLKSEDTLRIQMGDLSWRNFVVTSAASYSLNDATNALYKDDTAIDKELHLITCDGAFDDATQTYDKRFIVVAKLVES